MESIVRYFSAAFFICYFTTVFVWPSVRTYRLTGVNPIVFGQTESVHDYVGRWFKIVLVFIPITIAFYWLGSIYRYLLPATYLQKPLVQWAGIIVCVASLLWTVAAQWHMGKSWRVGIDTDHATELKRTGLFGYSRNPIFLGMMVTLAGFFLLLPNAVTLLVLVAGYLLMQIQVRLEEEFLQSQHGTVYVAYCNEVRRWL